MWIFAVNAGEKRPCLQINTKTQTPFGSGEFMRHILESVHPENTSKQFVCALNKALTHAQNHLDRGSCYAVFQVLFCQATRANVLPEWASLIFLIGMGSPCGLIVLWSPGNDKVSDKYALIFSFIEN